MTVYDNQPINDDIMLNIASYMRDDIREDLHAELAPCTNEEFIKAYLERDPDFKDLLVNEFGFKH